MRSFEEFRATQALLTAPSQEEKPPGKRSPVRGERGFGLRNNQASLLSPKAPPLFPGNSKCQWDGGSESAESARSCNRSNRLALISSDPQFGLKNKACAFGSAEASALGNRRTVLI